MSIVDQLGNIRLKQLDTGTVVLEFRSEQIVLPPASYKLLKLVEDILWYQRVNSFLSRTLFSVNLTDTVITNHGVREGPGSTLITKDGDIIDLEQSLLKKNGHLVKGLKLRHGYRYVDLAFDDSYLFFDLDDELLLVNLTTFEEIRRSCSRVDRNYQMEKSRIVVDKIEYLDKELVSSTQ